MGQETARDVLKIEADAISNLIDRIGAEFDTAEEILYQVKGRVIVTGLGKSGIVARKIASTLSSIGIPAFFLHPVEGAHGDIGMAMRGDVAIVISKSGATEELTYILNHMKRLEIPIIAITGTRTSALVNIADVVLDSGVEYEACPHNIVPTASTITAMALGDALAMSLFKRKGLTTEDFASLHPGGTIGTKLSYKVKDLMISEDRLPLVVSTAPMNEVIEVMSEKKLGIAIVVDKGKAIGVLTDGDLRRLLQRLDRPLEVNALEALEKSTRDNTPRVPPVTIDPDAYAGRAVNLMEKYVITSLVVTTPEGKPLGLIRWIELSMAGIV